MGVGILASLGFLAQTPGSSSVIFPPGDGLVLGTRTVVVALADQIQTPQRKQVLRAFKEGDLFHLVLKLNPGPNPFRLILVRKGTVERLQRVIHSFPSRHYQGKQKRLRFHAAGSLPETCIPCHGSAADQENPCWSCHADKKGEVPHPHEGFDPEDCSVCHDENTQAVTTNCLDCHDEAAGRQHAPYATGDCFVCHEAHGGPEAKLLRTTVRATCTLCHNDADYREGAHPVSQHPMESKDLTCVSCHNPHASPFPAFLKWDPEISCGACHEVL